MTFSTYANVGPWTNNALPSISSTFLNNLESFLDQIVSSIVADSHITSDGLGNITALGNITFTANKAKLIQPGSAYVLDASAGTDLLLNAPNSGGGHKVVLLVGGTRVFSSDIAGNCLYLNTMAKGTP